MAAPWRIKCPRLWHQVQSRTNKKGAALGFIDYYNLPPYSGGDGYHLNQVSSQRVTTTTENQMTCTITKTDELAALRQLINELGPDSYLGPWLADAFDHLAADIRADIAPLNPMDQYKAATKWRIDTDAHCKLMQAEARQKLDKAQATAEAIVNAARLEADNIRGRAYQRLHLCLKELEG